MRLAGKTILITAAGQGIGRASALACSAQRARVIATDLDLLRGLDTEFHRLDVTDAAAVLALPDGLANMSSTWP
jgi:2-keto-3-deoxy-L-fuconate dehydrogenase